MKKKILSLTLVVCLLAIAVVGGTLAYFTDKSEVATNTFSVGDVTIELDEADVDLMGNKIKDAEGNDVERVTENAYKLVPGHLYTKDPTVTVLGGSEESYVRMFVTINKAGVLNELFPGFLPQNYVEGTWDATKWAPFGLPVEGEDTLTYEFRYYTTVCTVNEDGTAKDAEKLPALFEEFRLPATLTDEDIEDLAGLTITVYAEAIQADGFADADAAFAALNAQGA